MLECPSCQQALPPHAHFCTHCGVRLSIVVTNPTPPIEPYAREKRQLAERSAGIMGAMVSLLPFVYEDRRAENQALFASTITRTLPLEDPAWGRVAFVLGAYGNYMYRYPLSLTQKNQVWQALLWSVFYERCFRRKYLTQRFQQLLHFLHGCANDPVFLSSALDDLEALRPYLEVSSLKKAVESLGRLPESPKELVQHLAAQLAATLQQAASSAQFNHAQSSSLAQPVRRVTKPLEHTPAQPVSGLVAASPVEKRARSIRKRGVGGRVLQATSTFEQPQNFQAFSHELSGFPDEGQRILPSDLPGDSAGASPQLTGWGAASGSARELLHFLNEEQCQEFLSSLRAARLETVSQLLRGAQRPLLVALCQALGMGESVHQEPRRPIRLGKKYADRFAEARHLLASGRASEQQRGLFLFEQGARETTHPDYIGLAREWMLYARAVVQGSPRVIDDWENARQRGEASWEELWNLAAFYQQTGYPAEALRVLRPEIETRRAPISHLRLALAAALCLLLNAGEENTGQEARVFLLAHLEHWPHPLCGLAWLVLAQETSGPLHPRQQSQRLSAFQVLAEQAQPTPDPRMELSASQIAEIEETLVQKVRYEEAWFFWINDYARRHPRTYQAWAKLAEACERLGRLENTEAALQHLVEIQYYHDYAHYQEGEPLPRARFLRRNLEKLFEFYQRHHLFEQGAEAFTSCYPALSHLWDVRDPENRKLLALTQSYLEARQHAEEEATQSRRELSVRELSRSRTVPLELYVTDRRVGIFIDYENIARFIPREMDIEEVGRILAAHAASFGALVCQWASASPQNLSNLADVRGGLEAAGFRVRLPRRELQFSPSKKNLADFALLECLSEAAVSERPDIYLIVSGDRDYYERVCSLLDTGHTVRLLAAADSQHLSLRYRELEQQRSRVRQEAGYAESDFFIDDLEALLCPLAQLN